MTVVPSKSRFIGRGGIDVSFEFSPPETIASMDALWCAIRRLEPLGPSSASVTYGADKAARARTHSIVARMLSETSLRPAVHMTCTASTRSDIDDAVKQYRNIGVRRIVALRGDPSGGVTQPFRETPGGYKNTVALIAGIQAVGSFDISVACYPEKHPESPSIDFDIDLLKAKVDAGATRAITQFFFDNQVFLRFRDRVRAAGIDIPIRPGIVPILNFRRIAHFASSVGVGVPFWLVRKFEGLGSDKVTRRLVAATLAAEQVLELVDEGVTEFHFFTLNRADLVFSICHLLGLRPGKGAANNN